MLKLVRRPMLLLEILIAIALISLCAIPLISPHIDKVRQERLLTQKMKLDHQIHLLYVAVLEQLHNNIIPYKEIENGSEFPVSRLIPVNPPLEGTYRFKFIKRKANKEIKDNPNLFVSRYFLIFSFPDKNESSGRLEFAYEIPIVRQIGVNNPVSESEPSKDKNDEE